MIIDRDSPFWASCHVIACRGMCLPVGPSCSKVIEKSLLKWSSLESIHVKFAESTLIWYSFVFTWINFTRLKATHKEKGLYACNLQLWYVMRRQHMHLNVRIAKYYLILHVYSKPYNIIYIIPIIADVYLLHIRISAVSNQLWFHIFLCFQAESFHHQWNK